MKRLIVYYSMSGNVEYVVDKIKDRLDCDILRLIPFNDYPNRGLKKYFFGGKSAIMGDTPKLEYDIDIKKYDLIIIGTPVWAGTFTPPIRSFINDNRNLLKGKDIAVFTCYSGINANKAIIKLKKYIGIDSFKGELLLIDPKDKENRDNDRKIEDFCKKLK